MTSQPPKFALWVGDPFDGVYLIGPFSNTEDIPPYAESVYGIRNSTWGIVEIMPPIYKENDNGNS